MSSEMGKDYYWPFIGKIKTTRTNKELYFQNIKALSRLKTAFSNSNKQHLEYGKADPLFLFSNSVQQNAES